MPGSSFVSILARPFTTLGSAVALVATVTLSASAPAAAHDPIDPPRPMGDMSQWFSGDNYPPAAMRAGQEGNVSVVLSINAQGLVTGCQVTKSSGVPALDARTCMLVTRRGRFVPARQGDQAVASTYDLHDVEWRIRDMSVHVPSSAPQEPAGQ